MGTRLSFYEVFRLSLNVSKCYENDWRLNLRNKLKRAWWANMDPKYGVFATLLHKIAVLDNF